jgi:hypothetical protein
MVNQDPEFVSEVLLNQIHNVKAGLLSAYPKNGLKDQLISGTRYNGNGSVEVFLSYHPNSDVCKESIDVIFSVACEEQKAVFSSEISWSDGKTIDEVVVCHMCPDCLDELQEKLEKLVGRTHEPLVDRMVVLLDNFCQD